MPRKHHLIQHAPPATMSEAEQIRHLSRLLRKCTDPAKALVLSREIRLLRELKKGVKKQHGGPPKKAKPPVEPEVVVNQDAVLEIEKQRRETPEPSIVYEHAQRAEIRAELKKEQEAVEISPITAPQSDALNASDGVAPPKQTGFAVVSPGLLDVANAIMRGSTAATPRCG
jgi:hypothetical protein